ncbi:hypothetical protein BGZ95_000447 [Linnemannia exigua]|uniref:Uncharacterized protein n=1 Tax=Linnemannia exigua TaxID=604196 RepID=A0AAD4D892_9FUNG|nr:hypothetical protein BGZ95_000447 [Linnemannia exigua]
MTRSLSIILFAAVAALAMVSQTVDAQSNKPQCAPIHEVYKSMTNKCTESGAAIPNSDGDAKWRPCVCAPGFYPVAEAAEKCVLLGTSQNPQITPDSLNALCTGFANYVPAAQQKAPDNLAPALTSASSLAAAMPTGVVNGGGDGGSNGGSGGSGGTSAASRSVDTSFMVMVGMTGFAAVVLATAAAF